MEFSYKLTESDYLRASGIRVKRPKRPWARVLSYVYLSTLFLTVWGSVVAGMAMERNDLIGVTSRELQDRGAMHGMMPAPILTGAILPSLILFGLLLLLVRVIFLWPRRMAGKEHFRADQSCQAETTVTATHNSIAFRSATGSSESMWGCFSTWAERNGILILVTRAGVRKILKTADLSEAGKLELRGILQAALPKR